MGGAGRSHSESYEENDMSVCVSTGFLCIDKLSSGLFLLHAKLALM